MSNSLPDRFDSCNGNVFAGNPLHQPAMSDFSVFGGPRSSTDLVCVEGPMEAFDQISTELFEESHPRNKTITNTNKSDASNRRGRGRPPTHGLSRTPIYTSYREAKSRCKNPRHSDYPNYGGRGIQFRFSSVTELFDTIGDRPPEMTLDRINPDGHYEVGNVRWASAKEQANNRRPADGFYQQRARSLRWHEASDTRTRYMEAAKHWLLCIRCLSEHKPQFSAEDQAFLEAQFAARAVPNASIWSEEYEYDEAHPCYLSLPSLNSPGSRVVLCAGAFVRAESSPLIERGILAGLVETPLALNCTKEELFLINSFVSDCRSGNGPSGLRFHGCNFARNDNLIEGRLLAMAARLRFFNLETRLLLASQVAALLSAGEHQQLLQPEYLIIPDLQMWVGAFGCDRLTTYHLHKVLSEREQMRLPTVVYIENPLELGQEFASLFTYRYRSANLENDSICHAASLPFAPKAT